MDLLVILKIVKSRWFQIPALVLIGYVIIASLNGRLETAKSQLEISRTNEKALNKGLELWKDRYGQEHAKSLLFTETIEQFKEKTDATSKAMMDMLNKQDKNIKNLEFLYYKESGLDTTTRIRTVTVMPDTVLDFSIKPHLVNVVTLKGYDASAYVKLTDSLLLRGDARREPIGPIKKTVVGKLLQNWFGKKHTVVEVDAVHTNPLLKTSNQKYIKILKD